MLSVILICRNAEKTISAALESVKNQTVSDYEFIVIDGDSTDGTMKIVRSYEPIISKLVSEPDNGPADAQNKGIAISTGSLITFLYADDYLSKDHIEKILVAENSCEFDFMYSDMYYTSNGNVIKKSIPNKNLNWTVRYRMPNVNFPTIVYKKKVFDRVGLFNTSYLVAPDYEHLLRLWLHGFKGKYVSNCTYNFQLGGNALTNLKSGLREVRTASIASGGVPIVAYIFFLFNLVRLSYIRYKLNNV